VEVVSPTEVRIQPQLGRLDWAEGSVPVKGGVVKVRAEKGKAAVVELPAGVKRLP